MYQMHFKSNNIKVKQIQYLKYILCNNTFEIVSNITIQFRYSGINTRNSKIKFN